MPVSQPVLVAGKWIGRTIEALGDAEYLIVPERRLAWLAQFPPLMQHLDQIYPEKFGKRPQSFVSTATVSCSVRIYFSFG